ncbi:four helix bundle protein [Mucilaginibacter gracilis]|uniref:Four helix bundle protein n=1 Tax=Mucilaginibacter gracilis TaxID=423350 RepID=A0A495J9E2_9SPHI|nr:four helix bundle protein [Mucilaginibacter gracilis]RKR85636.1 four helix bundle protein [Mucilaginibacter gracilis]
MKRHNFKNLKIWEKAMDFTDLTYDYCKGLPTEERYNLIDQINRCSCSVPSNIAEGSGKRTNVHFAEFLSTALSSSYEAETQLLICERRTYGDKEKIEPVFRIGCRSPKNDICFQGIYSW